MRIRFFIPAMSVAFCLITFLFATDRHLEESDKTNTTTTSTQVNDDDLEKGIYAYYKTIDDHNDNVMRAQSALSQIKWDGKAVLEPGTQLIIALKKAEETREHYSDIIRGGTPEQAQAARAQAPAFESRMYKKLHIQVLIDIHNNLQSSDALDQFAGKAGKSVKELKDDANEYLKSCEYNKKQDPFTDFRLFKDDYAHHMQQISVKLNSRNMEPEEYCNPADRQQQMAFDAAFDFYLLGLCHQKGFGTPKNEEAAFEMFTTIAASARQDRIGDKAHTWAFHNLGFMYENGHGVTKDCQKAIENYQRAIKQGHAPSMHNLANLYFTGEGGVKQNYQEALSLYSKAYEKRFHSKIMMDHMHRRGLGISHDYKASMKHYNAMVDRKIERDALPALYQLSCLLIRDDLAGVIKTDLVKAFEMCQQATQFIKKDQLIKKDQRFKPACLLLAEMYKKGIGVEPDLAKSEEWLKIATEQKEAVYTYKLEPWGSQSNVPNYNIENVMMCTPNKKMVEDKSAF